MRPTMTKTSRLKAFAAGLGLLAAVAAPAQDGRAARETQVVRVVRKVAPAVVYISCQQRVQSPFSAPGWDLFGDMFPGFQSDEEETSLGSGVLVDPAGFVLTNEHVIQGGTKILVTLNTGKQYPAKAVGTAPEADLALLKIEGDRPFPAVELGRSDDLMIGETVIAVGNPFGLSNTVTVGVLSATGRTVSAGKRRYADFLQTDAAINPGNSGGPLCNILGQVIGINTAIIRQAQGIGFAIPVDRARRVMEQLRAYGQVRPAWLGFLPLDLNEATKRRLGLAGGVYVARVYAFAHPGASALEEGDIISSVNGKNLDGVADLNSRLALLPPGERVELSGLRDKKPFTARIPLALLPESLTEAMAWELLGLKVQGGGRQGLLVRDVRSGSPAARTGIRPGDALLAVDDQPVDGVSDFLKRARTSLTSTGLLVSVGRGPWTYYVTLNLFEP
jgi:serine protease Do